jgi:HK97 family phage major capsid protein
VEDIIVRSEPLTYREGGAHSFFQDMAKAEIGDGAAAERMARHEVEMRTNPNSSAGTGGEFTVPTWLIDRFAPAASAGRPLADLVGSLPLPAGASSIHVPRMSTGTVTGVQSDGGAVASRDIVTADASSPVVTIAGMSDVSQQLMDLSPGGFDAYAYVDLMQSYNAALEAQLIAGTGTNGQLLGVTEVSGVTSVDGSSASTVATLWPLLGKAAAGVGNTRLMQPTHWLAAPRRWFWLTSQVDTTNQRPILTPGEHSEKTDFPAAGGASPVGPILGLPTYLDGAIPAGSSADVMVCCRPSDMLLFESEPHFMAAVQPLAGTLQVRLSLHRYAAFIPHRYPASIGIVTGLAQPSGY